MSDNVQEQPQEILPVPEKPKENYNLDVAVDKKHDIKISNEEWFEISLLLEDHHAVFYQFWQMGKPIFDERIPTAAVSFDRQGKFMWFHFNPEFWKSLDMYNRCFVICHEALHIILNHGIRSKDVRAINAGATNAALDVVVNHSLVRNFGFIRSQIQGAENFCWVDTVFKNKNPQPAVNETFEHYYSLFDKIKISLAGLKTVDDHSEMGDGGDMEVIINELNEELTEEEKTSLRTTIEKHFQKKKEESKNQKAGTGTGGQWVFAKIGDIKKKKKWETVIRNWSKKYLIDKSKDIEQWARLNRRMSILPKDMFLPSEMEIEDEDKEKTRIPVYFFMDTSGSCWDLKDRFFAAASSLPEERFDVKLLCFDTQVVETTLESKKIYGGGGTAFSILEEYIQGKIKEGGEYPEAVFVITDGYGNHIKCQQPEKWHWFLTKGGTRDYIEKNCQFFNLDDFE